MALMSAPATRPNELKPFQSTSQIQQHLRERVRALREADVSAFPPALRARRAFLTARLEAYAERGVFPHNHVLPHQTPIFLDEHDTACAVGQLIIDSGHRELAERVRAQDNAGYLLELQVEGLAEWVATSGFTAAELADIQSEYQSPTSNSTCIIQTDFEAANARFVGIVRPKKVFGDGPAAASAVDFAVKLFFVDRTK